MNTSYNSKYEGAIVFCLGLILRLFLLINSIGNTASSSDPPENLLSYSLFSWPWTYLLVGYEQSNEILVECHFRSKYLGMTSIGDESSISCPSGLLKYLLSFILEPRPRSDNVWLSNRQYGSEINRMHYSLSAVSLIFQILILLCFKYIGPFDSTDKEKGVDVTANKSDSKESIENCKVSSIFGTFPLWGINWLNPLVMLSCPLSPLPSLQHLLIAIFFISNLKRLEFIYIYICMYYFNLFDFIVFCFH